MHPRLLVKKERMAEMASQAKVEMEEKMALRVKIVYLKQ